MFPFMPLYKIPTLWHARVFNMWFYHRYTVVFKIIIEIDMTNSVMLIWRLVYCLFVPSIEP